MGKIEESLINVVGRLSSEQQALKEEDFSLDKREESILRGVQLSMRLMALNLAPKDEFQSTTISLPNHDENLKPELPIGAKMNNMLIYASPFKSLPPIGQSSNSTSSSNSADSLKSNNWNDDEWKHLVGEKELKLTQRFAMFISIFTSYVFLKHAILAVALQYQDSLLRRVRPTVRLGANRTEQCALPDDLLFDKDSLQGYRILIGLDRVWNTFGEPYSTLLGVGASYYCVMISYPLAFYMLNGWLLKRVKIRVDLLSFLFNPKLEKSRIKAELNLIMENVIKSAFNFAKEAENYRKRMLFEEMAKNSSSREKYLMSESSAHGNRALSFARLFLEGNFIDLVKPINLTPQVYKIQLALVKGISVFIFTFSGLAAISLICVYLNMEIFNRFTNRRELSECKLWNPNGLVLMKSHIQFEKLDAERDAYSLYSTEELLAYSLQNDTTLWNQFKVALSIEFKRFLSVETIIRLLEIGTLTFFNAIWFGLHSALYCAAHIDKLVWMSQIVGQIDYYIQRATISLETNKGVCKPSLCSSQNAEANLNAPSDLLEAFSVAYLNFHLFRNQQKNYQHLASLMMVQVAIPCIVSLAICYYLGYYERIGTAAVPVVFMSTCVVFFTNFYLTFGALMKSRIDQLMKRIFSLIAISSQIDEFKSSFALDLWRRQLVGEIDTRRIFAPSALGINLSFSKIVSLNLYLAALWLLISIK